LKLDKPRLPVRYVDSLESLAQLNTALKGLTRVALDAERASGFRYSQRAYLIQIATDTEIFLVDPSALTDLDENWSASLAEVLNPITWLLHAATQDLPCLAELGIFPSAIIDTELGSRLAGLERVGLGSIALELLDLELAKEHSAADWSLRPLSEEMLDYAALDVDVMFEVWEKLESILSEQGKLAWAFEEFEHLVSFKPKPIAAEPWRNLPGLSKVKDITRVKIAAGLWLLRDEIARERDVAPGRLVPDRSIAAVIEQPPKSKSELASNKAFQGRASRSLLNEWWQAIVESKDLDIELTPKERGNGIPSHRSWEKRFPDAYRRLEKTRPLLVALGEELKIPVENLLTPDTLRRVCFEPASDVSMQLAELGARPWQVALTADLIRAGFEKAESLPEA
jgi:ribonuclease D